MELIIIFIHVCVIDRGVEANFKSQKKTTAKSYSAIPPSIFKSLPESSNAPLSEYLALDMNAIN